METRATRGAGLSFDCGFVAWDGGGVCVVIPLQARPPLGASRLRSPRSPSPLALSLGLSPLPLAAATIRAAAAARLSPLARPPPRAPKRTSRYTAQRNDAGDDSGGPEELVLEHDSRPPKNLVVCLATTRSSIDSAEAEPSDDTWASPQVACPSAATPIKSMKSTKSKSTTIKQNSQPTCRPYHHHPPPPTSLTKVRS